MLGWRLPGSQRACPAVPGTGVIRLPPMSVIAYHKNVGTTIILDMMAPGNQNTRFDTAQVPSSTGPWLTCSMYSKARRRLR
jgi:hypothetical protein